MYNNNHPPAEALRPTLRPIPPSSREEDASSPSDFSPTRHNGTTVCAQRHRSDATQMLERTAFYTVSGTFVLYLTRGLGYDNAAADTQLGLWNGACYVCPLLGG